MVDLEEEVPPPDGSINITDRLVGNQLSQVRNIFQEDSHEGNSTCVNNIELGSHNFVSGFDVSEGTIRRCNSKINLGTGASQSEKI